MYRHTRDTIYSDLVEDAKCVCLVSNVLVVFLFNGRDDSHLIVVCMSSDILKVSSVHLC